MVFEMTPEAWLDSKQWFFNPDYALETPARRFKVPHYDQALTPEILI